MSGKRKKKGGVPPQSVTPKGTGKLKLVKGPASDEEISEMDALRFRLAVQKDNNVLAAMKEIESEQQALDQKKEALRLRTIIVRGENERDVGHLNIKAGDNVYEKDGKWFMKRAPQGPPARRGPVAPPGPPAPPSKDPEGGGAAPGGEGEGK